MSLFFLTVILLGGRESWVIYSSSTILPNSPVSPLQKRIIHLKYESYRTLQRCGWGIPTCGIWRCLIGCLVPDVSTKRTVLIKSLEVWTSRPLKMKTCSFETSGTDSHVTRRHIPEEWYQRTVLISGSMKDEELYQLSGYQLLKVFIPQFELEMSFYRVILNFLLELWHLWSRKLYSLSIDNWAAVQSQPR
jgi:hypothetical protein